jgi:malonyl-CoA/methylmalonyl-CoA synthetase
MLGHSPIGVSKDWLDHNRLGCDFSLRLRQNDVPMTNLSNVFRTRWRDAWNSHALAPPGGRAVTYGELDRLSAQMARLLRGHGLNPGERVVAQIDKSVGGVVLYLAVLRAGGVFVPLNPAYTPAELSYFLKDAQPFAFFGRPGCEGASEAARRGARVPYFGTVDPAIAIDATGIRDDADEAVPRADEDLAAIVYTSGTTGRSKGAMITHSNLASNALALHRIWGFTPGDVLLHALPIYHVHGLFVALHTAFLNGSKIVFHEKFDAGALRRDLPLASVLMGVPTFYTRLLDAGITREECAHMRLFVSGSAPLTRETFAAWEARTGKPILERYGMTETGMIASNPLGGARVAGTVGYALPGVRVRIADDEGREIARGEIGTIEVKGPNVFSGYWRMPEKTAQEFRADGYFITGDLGTMEEDGRVAIVGRAKDLIIAGGLNIYPKEIEEVLDAVAGVAESAVVGVPHAEMGEGALAVLVPAAKGAAVSDAVLQAALDARLARFKHPRKFVWVEALPKNAMGKVEKAALRERYKDAYRSA